MYAELNRTAHSNKNAARGTAFNSGLSFLGSHQLPFHAGLVLDDMARHRARGHGKRTGQVHLARPTASGEIPVLRADYHLLRPSGHPRPSIYARAATGLNHLRSSFLED